jgi:hypothetical protein
MENSVKTGGILPTLSAKSFIIEIVLTVITLICYSLAGSGSAALMCAMLLLSFYYFMSAYFIHGPDGIYFNIAVKVAGIAGAVALNGVLFANLGMEGAKQMCLIGMTSLGAVSIILLFALIKTPSKELLLVVVRSIVLAGLAYVFFSKEGVL